jgi:hypothetical protein
MPNPKIRIHDISTNEIIDREMNDDEFAQYEIDQNLIAQEKASETAKAAAKSALLERLGISAEEALLLLS